MSNHPDSEWMAQTENAPIGLPSKTANFYKHRYPFTTSQLKRQSAVSKLLAEVTVLKCMKEQINRLHNKITEMKAYTWPKWHYRYNTGKSIQVAPGHSKK